MPSIRVLVVDDSAVVRQLLAEQLNRVPGIEVIATAPDPYIARDRIVQYMPDAMTLDVEMPRMDGLTFLRKLMKHKPIPTIVVSSLTPKGSDMAMDALACGAVDVINKPGASYKVGDIIPVLAEQLKAAVAVDIRKIQKTVIQNQNENSHPITALKKTTNKIFAIGASTGGTQAIEVVMKNLPSNAPGVVIVQHMPEAFTHSFAERLDKMCAMRVQEARDGDHVIPGVALIAPGNYHMEVRRSGAVYVVKLHQGPREHFQRPAVDVLFRSLAKHAGANVVAAILTGMGKDGAQGLLELRQSGARTIGQDEASSIVYGMPAEAFRLGAVQVQLPLSKVASQAMRWVEADS